MKVKNTLSIILGMAVVCIFTASIFLFIHGVLKDNDSTKELESESLVKEITVSTEKMIEQKEKEETKKIEENKPKLVSLGEFRLTAYCSCHKCCLVYATNRPIDENGKEIVYGSIGERLREGYSIAVDPNVIPYRTEVVIDGKTYKAQDSGGAIKGNRIDIYFSSHQAALNFGVQYAEVFKVVK